MGFFDGLFNTDVKYDAIKDEYTLVGMLGLKEVTNRYGNDNLKMIFHSLGLTESKFYGCFKYEVISILQDLIKRPNYYVNVKKIKEVLDKLLDMTEDKILDPDNKLNFKNIEKMKFKPFDYQSELFNHYESYKKDTGNRGLLVGAAAGTGKALANGTLVKSSIGWVPIENLKVGDRVLGVDSNYTKVTGVYPQGNRMLYRVTFQDGRTIDCDGEHLWTIYSYNKDKDKKDLSTLTTLEIKELLDTQFTTNYRNKYGIYIPGVSSRHTDIALPINPYVLGTILASGNITNALIINTKDKGVRANLVSKLPTGIKLDTIDSTRIVANSETTSYLPVLKQFKLLNTTNDELYIPETYLDASENQKLELLRGMMDITGYVNQWGDTVMYLDNKRLVNSVCKLVWSLGGLCYTKEPDVRLEDIKDKSIIRKYRLVIKLNVTDAIITRVTNGTENLSAPIEEYNLVRIESIDKLYDGLATCIKVEDPKELFVIENYIVTHNTYISLTFSEMLEADKVLVICPLPVLEKVWVKSIKEELYKDSSKNSIWSSKGPIAYTDEKFILCHYEALESLYSILPKIAGTRLTVIVDESHNFADPKSKRTILLQDIISRSFTKNLFLLSGTPIKSYSTEIINIAKLVDGKLTDDNFTKLYKIYSNPNKFFRSILPGRYNDMTYVIEKKETELEPVNKIYLPVKLKNSDMYTLPYIRNEMKTFIYNRIAEIEANMPKYLETYELCLKLAVENGFEKKTSYTIKQYRDLVAVIQSAYKKKQLGFIPKEMELANKIENAIKTYLPNELAKQWVDIKTLIKYPLLKVQGECLGLVVMRARINCHKDIAASLDYPKILDSTLKDTIIFSNYVEVGDTVVKQLSNLKLNVATVYGSTTHLLNKEVKHFTEDKTCNPLVTTYKSLSTGVPLTNANVILAIDLPFRMYVFEQAISRAWRVGQDSQVVVYIPSLDTGSVPNINQRNLDIISFFNEEVEALTGFKSAVDVKATDDINLESIDKFDMYLKDYDTEMIHHKALLW